MNISGVHYMILASVQRYAHNIPTVQAALSPILLQSGMLNELDVIRQLS